MQKAAAAPRAQSSNRIWDAISAIQLFACKVCEVIHGGCYKTEKIAIVERELSRIFSDPKNIINCEKRIVHWQGQVEKLGLKIDQYGIEMAVSGMSQKELALLSREFSKNQKLGWFVGLLKKKARDDFERDLKVAVQNYFSIPLQDRNTSVMCREKTLAAIREMVENFETATPQELKESVQNVLLQEKKTILLRHLEDEVNSVKIAAALVEFLKKEMSELEREKKSELGVPDARQRRQLIKTNKLRKSNPLGISGPTRNVPSEKIENKQRTSELKKLSFSVKQVFSALSCLTCASKENSLERAAFSLIKLSAILSEIISFKEIEDELVRQFDSLIDLDKERVVACGSSGKIPVMDLTGRTIRSSIGMKINQDAIDILNKSVRSAEGKHSLDDIERNVSRVLDVIETLKVKAGNDPEENLIEKNSLNSEMPVEVFQSFDQLEFQA